MASILDRYGIKEVADVTFYEITNDGKRGNPVLYLDTLKVSTIEQTAETSDARGGKGNPKLITWDYGKDITVTLEDALFSPKSLAIMFGDGKVREGNDVLSYVEKTVVTRASNGSLEAVTVDVYENNKPVRKKVGMNDFNSYNLHLIGIYKADGTQILQSSISTLEDGEKVFVTYKLPAVRKEIIVSADSFPGTYYVTGDTYARSDVTGEDQFFQFIIEKAKVTSENTITLEAEGEPSVFNMNLTVLRPESGEMMRLVQYDLQENLSLVITGASKIKVDETIILSTDAEDPSSVTWSVATDDQGEVEIADQEDGTVKVTGKKVGAAKIIATAGKITGTHIIEIAE